MLEITPARFKVEEKILANVWKLAGLGNYEFEYDLKFSLDNKRFPELFDFILFMKLKMATCTHKDGSLSKERFKQGLYQSLSIFSE